MIPVVTPDEMAAVDAAAPEPIDVLIERAGAAVAWHARRMLGGTYGKRIVVIAGKGNNGSDGRVAARRLADWGARVEVVDPDTAEVNNVDLVIDAAYGTGLTRAFDAPTVASPVRAVDIPSGVDGRTGQVTGRALSARETITFQALKPGLVFGPGARLAGDVEVVDLGLDVTASRAHVVEAADVADRMPARAADAHKWHHAVWVVAGSQDMLGAAGLAVGGAARAGAGYVRVSSPGVPDANVAVEAVHHQLPATGWADEMGDLHRFASVVVGPGLGRGPDTAAAIGRLLSVCRAPMVVDADALALLGTDVDAVAADVGPRVLTPHDGEYAALTGSRPGADRIAAARELAAQSGAVVLLKGPATVVAAPDGTVRITTSGDERLATAGTGDVLAGIVGALLALGADPMDAASCGSWLHGKAAEAAPRRGMVASDLLSTLPEVIDATHVG